MNSSDLRQTVERLEESKVRQQYEHALKQYQTHVSRLESEKYFFRRLSNDLKVALSSYRNQVVNQLVFPRLYYMILQGNNNSIIQQFDEESVRELLAESKQACGNKTASWEIKHGLDQLRDEICNLQTQIVMKSGRS